VLESIRLGVLIMNKRQKKKQRKKEIQALVKTILEKYEGSLYLGGDDD